MTKEEEIERYGLEWYEEYKVRNNERCKVRNRERYHNDPEYREYQRKYKREYYHNELNSAGTPKNIIRCQSKRILFNKHQHSRIKGYEIHHCFGYDDPSKFIYIPKSLHCKIHQYLRDNNIDADSNHYDFIKHMINECQEYTYISV